MTMQNERLQIFSSRDMSLDFNLQVQALHGLLPRSLTSAIDDEIFVTARLIFNDEPLTSDVSTVAAVYENGFAEWKEKVSFPITVRDLPRETQLEFSVCELRVVPSTVLCSGRMAIFSDNNRLIQGSHSLMLSPADETSETLDDLGIKFVEQQAELHRLEDFLVQYEQGHLRSVNWLDNLVFQRIRDARKSQLGIARTSDFVQLMLEFPVYVQPVVYHPQGEEERPLEVHEWQRLTWLVDDEVNLMLENPAERKHPKLSRSVGRGVVDMELKPDGSEKRRLAAILKLPPTRPLDMESQNLLWKFRFAMRHDPKALTKFLKCVDWTDPAETKASVQLMREWAPIGPAAALELLTPTFTNGDVRRYAVAILRQAEDEDLLMYLLQLVQVRLMLCYIDERARRLVALSSRNLFLALPIFLKFCEQALRYETDDENELAKFLVERAVENEVVGNYLYWYVLLRRFLGRRIN